MSVSSIRLCCCGKPLARRNLSGKCGACYNAARQQAQVSMDERLARAIIAKRPFVEIAREFGCPISRIRAAAQRRTAPEAAQFSMAAIVKVCSDITRIPAADIRGKSRRLPHIRARMILYVLALEAGHSSVAVGRFAGGKDHTTVLSGRDKANDLAKEDPALTTHIAAARKRLLALAKVEKRSDTLRGPARTRLVKPRNNFVAVDHSDEDEGHRFANSIAAGSHKLLVALQAYQASAA